MTPNDASTNKFTVVVFSAGVFTTISQEFGLFPLFCAMVWLLVNLLESRNGKPVIGPDPDYKRLVYYKHLESEGKLPHPDDIQLGDQ